MKYLGCTGCLFLMLSGTAIAGADDPVLLWVEGAIDAPAGDAVAFNRSDLEALDPVTLETTTIWTSGPQTFVGVELGRLLEEVGAQGETVRAFAANDYSAQIPAEDWVSGGAIVAYMLNGEPMSLRDKGPLWIVYPYDDSSDWRREVVFARSVWHMQRIEVE